MTTSPKKFTVRDYDSLPEGSPYQLIDGELVMTPSPTFDHQDIVSEIVSQLRDFVKKKNLGRAVASPIDAYLAETEPYQPDIIYISDKRKNIIVEGRAKGSPDLVMEVLSPSNAYYDLGHKKNVYAASGVKEYWVVDPEEKTIEIHRNIDGRFQLVTKVIQTGSAESTLLPGFSAGLQDLFLQ